jgi:putative hydrolase of the HAD superfamily
MNRSICYESSITLLRRAINSVKLWKNVSSTIAPDNCSYPKEIPQKIQQQHRYFGSWPKIRPLRIRAITMDVTGTLVSFRGSLKQHYVKSAEKCGITLSQNNSIQFDQAFKLAYKEISQCNVFNFFGIVLRGLRWCSHLHCSFYQTKMTPRFVWHFLCVKHFAVYPCFGHNTITGKEWWRHCVLRSFEIAGANMTQQQKDRVFQRIYSIFGSQVAYERFDDALPFLHWANRNHIACGLLSNADERYGDSILPMLGLTHDEIQFRCFSKYYGYEKPDHRFFVAAIERAEDSLKEMKADSNTSNTDQIIDPLLPSHCLHVGNDYTKDFEAARRAGMHAVLLDRYDEPELAEEWRRRGAIVLKDLMDIVEFLGRSNCQLGDTTSTKECS